MPKPPFKKIKHNDPETDRFQGHTEDALNWLGERNLDDWEDGDTYRRTIGVNHRGQLTNSGIATSTITAEKILTVSGTSLLTGTVPGSALQSATITIDKLAACNQFSVYRNAAFTCPAGVYSALYADKVVKDTGNGWSQANAWYQIPTAGDWSFSWSVSLSPANSGKEVVTALVINSGLIFGSVHWTTAASQYLGSVGTYLYCNAMMGDKIKVQVFNGDSGALSLNVTSGQNFFCGYQVR